jgi:hypothetical protein
MATCKFATVSHGETIWTVEQYCRHDSETLHHAVKANEILET